MRSLPSQNLVGERHNQIHKYKTANGDTRYEGASGSVKEGVS